jgi:hypothetical protein
MPPFENLGDQERWDVLAYTYTMNLPAEKIARGQELYAVNCAQCHGPQGDALPTANLLNPQFMAGQSGTAVFRAIDEGVPPAMPALGGQWNAEDIWALVETVRTFAFDMSVAAEPTPVPPTAAPEPTEAAAEATAPSAVETTPAAGAETVEAPDPNAPEASPTPEAPATAAISGAVTNASGGSLPDGLAATLHIFDMVSSQEVGSLDTQISDGIYSFTGVALEDQSAYIVTVMYQDVYYDSEAAFYDGTTPVFDLPVTVYESTTDLTALHFTQVHVAMEFSTEGMVQFYEIFVFQNPGTETVLVPSDGTRVPFIQVPPEAGEEVRLQLSESSERFLPAKDGFAILPGAERQYGIVASYALPYTRRLELELPFVLPASSVTILAPAGVRVRGERLTDQGRNSMGGAEYQTYAATDIAAGESLSLTVSGLPGDAGLFPLTRQNGIIIGMGTLGTILIAAGVYLFLRDRARNASEESNEDEDALGDDPEVILDAIIALDDQFKDGGISQEAYEERRAALKARLKDAA